MKINKSIVFGALMALALFAAVVFTPTINASMNKNELPESENHLDNHHEVKNIIFMVPDGMGMADVTAARIYKSGTGGAPLYFETLENIGYQRTYSNNSIIPDSASAGSAWACGEKFNNGGQQYLARMLKIATVRMK